MENDIYNINNSDLHKEYKLAKEMFLGRITIHGVICTTCKKFKLWKDFPLNILKTNNRRCKACSKIYIKNRLKSDINFKIKISLRSRINHALKNKNKSDKTLNLLGCTINELKNYLELQFKLGMTWNNHGNGCHGKGMKEWHIDHIKPCASFDLSKPEEQRKCFHYTNLQPLWATENLKKHKKENYTPIEFL